ncbi:hypothetical protein HGJ18_01760 [Treponema denticola]|nr:hypothetical protein HGJ18_01760 [Treponema denticola]
MHIVKTGNSAASMRYAIPEIANKVKYILSNRLVILQDDNIDNAGDKNKVEEFLASWRDELDVHLNEVFDILSNAYESFNDSLLDGDKSKAYAALEIFTDGSFIKKISKKFKVIEEWYEKKYREALIIELKDSSLDKWLINREVNWLEEALQNDINEVLAALEALKEPAKNFIKEFVGSGASMVVDGLVKGLSHSAKNIISNPETGWVDCIADGVRGIFGNNTEYDEIEAKFTASMNRIIETFDFTDSINSIVVNRWSSEKAFQEDFEEDNLQIEYKNESNDVDDISSRLKKLKELFDKGILDEDEYKAKKKELIDLL